MQHEQSFFSGFSPLPGYRENAHGQKTKTPAETQTEKAGQQVPARKAASGKAAPLQAVLEQS